MTIKNFQEVGKEEEAQQGLYRYNPKMKKVFQASNIVAQLTGSRFIMPLTQNYELSDIPKVQPEGYSTFRGLCFVEVMAKIFIRIVHIHLITSITIERKL